MDTYTQVFGDNRTAARALFAGVARVNLQEQSTSTGAHWARFVGCELCQLAPSNIGKTLVEFVAKDNGMVTHHIDDGKFFKDNHAVGIHQFARLLVTLGTPRRAVIAASMCAAAFCACGSRTV